MKRMLPVVVCHVVAILACFVVPPFDVFAISGNQWNTELSQQGRQAYVIAIVDSWELVRATTLKYPSQTKAGVYEEIHVEVAKCISDEHLPYSQLVAIVDKWMKDNPNAWQYSMPTNIYTAIKGACDKMKR